MGRVPGNDRVRPLARQDRRAGLAVAGAVARLQAGDAPGLGQLPAERTCPAAACQQARGLGPAAGAAELLGPGDDESLIGSQLEDAGELGLAVGLAAELAVDRRTFLVQRPVIGPGGDQAVEIPEGLGPAPGCGAFDGAVSLEVQDLLPRAQPLGLLVIGGGLVELVGQGPRAGPAARTGASHRAGRRSGGRGARSPRRRCRSARPRGSSARARRDRHRAARRRDRGGQAARAARARPGHRAGRSPGPFSMPAGRSGPRFAGSSRRGSNPGAARERARYGIRRTRRWRRPTGHRT